MIIWEILSVRAITVDKLWRGLDSRYYAMNLIGGMADMLLLLLEGNHRDRTLACRTSWFEQVFRLSSRVGVVGEKILKRRFGVLLFVLGFAFLYNDHAVFFVLFENWVIRRCQRNFVVWAGGVWNWAAQVWSWAVNRRSAATWQRQEGFRSWNRQQSSVDSKRALRTVDSIANLIWHEEISIEVSPVCRSEASLVIVYLIRKLIANLLFNPIQTSASIVLKIFKIC